MQISTTRNICDTYYYANFKCGSSLEYKMDIPVYYIFIANYIIIKGTSINSTFSPIFFVPYRKCLKSNISKLVNSINRSFLKKSFINLNMSVKMTKLLNVGFSIILICVLLPVDRPKQCDFTACV